MRLTVQDENPQVALAVVTKIMQRAPEILISTVKAGSVEALAVWDSERDAHNTFDAPDRVKPRALDGVCLRDGYVRGELPPACVALLTVKP